MKIRLLASLLSISLLFSAMPVTAAEPTAVTFSENGVDFGQEETVDESFMQDNSVNEKDASDEISDGEPEVPEAFEETEEPEDLEDKDCQQYDNGRQ